MNVSNEASTSRAYIESNNSAHISPSSSSIAPASKPLNSSVVPVTKESSSSSNTTVATLRQNVLSLQKTAVIRFEIMWSITRVTTRTSTRGAERISKTFPLLFPDSTIAQEMSLKKDKIAYCITYGLGPYFRQILLEEVQNAKTICISIDESLNKVCQSAQMDVIVRFWDSSKQEVSTRYLASIFPERCTSDGLFKAITNALKDLKLNLSNVLQVAMDGPNVNLKLHSDLLKYMEENGMNKILNLGTCTLHIVHNGYKTAHDSSNWNIHRLLRSLYYLFKDFPTRRADYKYYTRSSLFPLKFCSVRWLENGKVLQRALNILPHVKKYVEGVKNKPPKTHNYTFVTEALKNEFLEAKLHFLSSVCDDLYHFLIQYQSDEPLMPFLYEDLRTVLRNIGTRFLSKVTYSFEDTKKNLLPPEKVNVGFGAKTIVSRFSPLKKLKFLDECRAFLKALYDKLLRKSSFKNKLVRSVSGLSPVVMNDANKRQTRIDDILTALVDVGHCSATDADHVKREYLEFCQQKIVEEELNKFSRSRHRIDRYLLSIIGTFEETRFRKLSTFVQTACLLFHGNAAVERSFSVNKECLIENLKEDSLVAQRYVFDFMKTINFCEDQLDINKKMISYFVTSGTKRNEALKKKQQSAEEKTQNLKRMNEEIQLLEFKKKKLLVEKEDELNLLDENIRYLKKKME